MLICCFWSCGACARMHGSVHLCRVPGGLSAARPHARLSAFIIAVAIPRAPKARIDGWMPFNWKTLSLTAICLKSLGLG